ncbi:Glycoside Hydrolase Family 5 protein [Ruminococcus bicirculans (ex Wegman et al. 2014)]|uniref:Glycoside Hydrolase Family 5 protein n=2 Tax=Ruminococcus bicirculans (ex Wegman et al. 2014) TaxID=1160721 RepID=A0ABP1WE25_9FIRM|nr:cellulase family glycosylhydrolase [Ruminococcus bicirculans (ex Wegman et al. 2014)]CCO03822.1 Glycoside Hydrolase Family 5 protein [Ruminococcus bicirculans (ex Wegman et al. 2014)]
MKSVSKRYLSFILSLLMAMTIFIGLDLGDINAQALSGDTLKNADTEAILEDMGLGWNLGNSLDATGGSGLDTETSWSNPKTTQALIDKVKSLGFNTVRVPVSWGKHVSGDNYTIDSAWLARVKEVVDYCYKNDMYVILNIHHDTKSSASASGAGYYPRSSAYSSSEKFVTSVWSQMAEYFKDYDYHLIFETLNEPRLIGTGYEWWFNKWSIPSEVKDAIDCINRLNQKAVDTIRNTGSNNKGRLIMCPGYDASIDGATVSGFKLPTDISGNKNRIAVSVHAYSPYNFAMNVGSGSTSTYTSSIKSELRDLFSTLKSNFRDKGIPVVIGEFGSTDKNNTAERVKWATDYTALAKKNNIPCVLWDNNAFAVYNGSSIVLNSEYHGYINRKNNTVTSPAKDVIEALMKPYGKKADLNCSSSVTIVAGQSKNIGASSSTSGAVLTYKSTTPSICTVDKNGNVTALRTGTGYVTITASANGYDSVSKDVKIVVSKKSLNNGLLTLSETSYVYDGTYKKPAATVTFGGKVLQEGKDYTISYRNNLNVGVTTVIATGMGDYTGYTSKNFTITKRAMAGGTVSVASSVSFTGSNITPSVTVKVAGRTLTSGTDYTVSYSNNKNVGTSNVYVYGKGNYSGSLSAKFDIVPAKQQIQKLETKYKGFYIDWAQKGSATGYDIEYSVNSNMSGAVSKHLTANKPDTLTVSGLSGDKTYYVRVRSYTNVNGKVYYGAWSDIKSIKTANNDITKATVSGISTKAFTGKAITQNVTVKVGNTVLKNGTDYTVSYSNNKKVGKATVKITGKGKYGGVITKTFKINPAKQEIQKLTAKSKAFFVDWAQKGSATGYEIQYATNSKFTGAKKVAITNNKTDKTTVSKLSGNKKYYVRVRSYTTVGGTKYYGSWSATKTVTTKK